MIFILFYIFIGLVSYPYMAKKDGIDLELEAWPYIIVAAAIWSIIWLPLLLHKGIVNKE